LPLILFRLCIMATLPTDTATLAPKKRRIVYGKKVGAAPPVPAPVPGADKPKIKKPYKYRPGTVALREIIRSMSGKDKWTGEYLIPKIALQRMVREICQDMGKDDVRFEAKAMRAVQEAAEMEVNSVFERGMTMAVAARRVTLMPMDMRHALYADRVDRAKYFGEGKLHPPVSTHAPDGTMYEYKGTQVLMHRYVPPSLSEK
jgi:histone H3